MLSLEGCDVYSSSGSGTAEESILNSLSLSASSTITERDTELNGRERFRE